MSTSNNTTAKTVVKAATAATQRRVYVGPTIPTIQAIRNRIYIGDLPASLQDVITNYPWFANLFCSFDEANVAQTSLHKKEGSYYDAYVKAVALGDSLRNKAN